MSRQAEVGTFPGSCYHAVCHVVIRVRRTIVAHWQLLSHAVDVGIRVGGSVVIPSEIGGKTYTAVWIWIIIIGKQSLNLIPVQATES